MLSIIRGEAGVEDDTAVTPQIWGDVAGDVDPGRALDRTPVRAQECYWPRQPILERVANGDPVPRLPLSAATSFSKLRAPSIGAKTPKTALELRTRIQDVSPDAPFLFHCWIPPSFLLSALRPRGPYSSPRLLTESPA